MKTLICAADIAERVDELGHELTEFYRDKPLTVVVVMNGAMIFGADLVRKIDLPLQIDSLSVSSYVNDSSCGELTFRSRLKLSVKDRHVLLVDDILDTGCTLKRLKEYFSDSGALSVKCCVLLDKILPDGNKFAAADYYGFRIPPEYVVGYGLDSDEKFRNLLEVASVSGENSK